MPWELQTPKRVGWLYGLATLLFTSAPFVEAAYYTTELTRGSYPPNADTIIIPISQFTEGWLVTAPIFWSMVWLCLRHYPGSVAIRVESIATGVVVVLARDPRDRRGALIAAFELARPSA